jgi:hypothetical protein
MNTDLKFSAVLGQMSAKSSSMIRPISVEPTLISESKDDLNYKKVQ